MQNIINVSKIPKDAIVVENRVYLIHWKNGSCDSGHKYSNPLIMLEYIKLNTEEIKFVVTYEGYYGWWTIKRGSEYSYTSLDSAWARSETPEKTKHRERLDYAASQFAGGRLSFMGSGTSTTDCYSGL